MQQVVQNIRSGETSVAEVPAPAVAPGRVLIANQCSLVSAGTEKMIMDLAKKSLLGKARERPDHVKRVLQKIRNEGLFETIDAVRKKLDEPMKMGYSASGVVVACGRGVEHFKPGDRVVSNGPHAEVVSVAQNLCATVPESVTHEQAAFGVLGSIALQGVRLSETRLGESVLVIGLGLVGQLTVALLHASGVRVFGTDPDAEKCRLATRMGATLAEPHFSSAKLRSLTGELGADAVVITASTKSNAPIEVAADAVRKKGRIVLVGVVGLEIDRRPFYFKECEFVVSCSYGPGRYDPDYEDRGHDYPAAYVRWTEQRNIAAVLQLMASGSLNIEPLISHRFTIDDAISAYNLIERGDEPYLGVLLQYPKVADVSARREKQTVRINAPPKSATRSNRVNIGVIGAGNFARMVVLPAIKQTESLRLKTIASAHGLSGTFASREAAAEFSTTDEQAVFEDPDIDAVFSITRHHQHFDHVRLAIEHGKSIFVEKPLCLNEAQLYELNSRYRAHGHENSKCSIMVGFNRRFAPAVATLKEFFAGSVEPLTVSFRFNAGDIPSDHWTQDELEGGGRLIGEACHAIDLVTYLVGAEPVRVFAESVANPTPGSISDDRCFMTMRHANGSVSNIAYLAGGDKAFPKERIEVIGGGRVGVIDDFRSVTLCQSGKVRTEKFKLDKGHRAEIAAWAEHLSRGIEAPIPWSELYSTTLASILAVRSLREGDPITLASASD